jgi:hypothetical protein
MNKEWEIGAVSSNYELNMQLCFCVHAETIQEALVEAEKHLLDMFIIWSICEVEVE